MKFEKYLNNYDKIYLFTDYCGQWKMLHYFAKNFFAPIIVSPEISIDQNYVSLYIVVDGTVESKNANLLFKIYDWSNKNWYPYHTIISSVKLVSI